MKLNSTCPFCGFTRQRDLPVTDEQLDAWQKGALIQDAMPQLDPDEREFVLTGICPDCWPNEELTGNED